MKYYKAREITPVPKLVFDLVFDTQYDGTAPEEITNDPLVVTETVLTDTEDEDYISFEFGICDKTISGGELQARLQAEIDTQEVLVNEAEALSLGTAFEQELNASLMTYDGKKFPMTPGSRERYRAIFEKGSGDHVLVTSTGNYTLLAANIADFKLAYETLILNASYTETV